MGRYVEFWKGFPDGVTGHFLSLIDQFQEWYEDFITGPYCDEASQDVFNLIKQVQKNPSKLKVRDFDHAFIVDHMISDFYGTYLDSPTNFSNLTDLKTPVLRIQRYEKWWPWITRNAGETIGKYWSFIINGRGIGRINDEIPFRSIDGCFFVGFWTIEECVACQKAFSKIDLPGKSDDPDSEIPHIVKDALIQAIDGHHGLIITVA